MTALALALAATHAAANTATYTGDRPWSAREFAALLAQPGVILAGTPRSFVLVRVILDEAEVLTIATHPVDQRQGLARAALQAAEKTARATGAITMFLEVAEDNLPARALYTGTGYAPMGRRPGYYHRANGSAVAALTLRKPL